MFATRDAGIDGERRTRVMFTLLLMLVAIYNAFVMLSLEKLLLWHVLKTQEIVIRTNSNLSIVLVSVIISQLHHWCSLKRTEDVAILVVNSAGFSDRGFVSESDDAVLLFLSSSCFLEKRRGAWALLRQG